MLRARDSAFRSGDRALYSAARVDLRRGIIKAKADYKTKIEEQLASNNPRQVWQGIQSITIYRGCDLTAGDSTSCGLRAVGCELWAASCGLRAVGSELWAASCGLRAVGCELWAASCGLLAVGCELWAASCGQRAVGSELWAASCGLRAVGCELWAASCGLLAVTCHCWKEPH
ncbi:182 kDa tankyrase-1-binding protein [Dissostichus eleginoides]|uniref:182 kDa tankyrase-1-binding protein n=1 Tax=Dissostichus eleginoides TaxID=100907 RepID=A0AAD9B438_DISEL|nr:182 kDa tankyrase-1-binding protein [Dissostichus eleginoides]